MKMGIRTPNLKKSLKARTTGKMKRSLKKAVNPLYGKKGIGYLKNPQKAVYNKVYNKTTVGVGDIAKTAVKNNSKTKSTASVKSKVQQAPPKQKTNKSISTTSKRNNSISKGTAAFFIFISVILILSGLILLIISPIGGILAIAFGIYCIVYANKHKK